MTDFAIHLTKSLKFKTQTHWLSTWITPPSKMMVESWKTRLSVWTICLLKVNFFFWGGKTLLMWRKLSLFGASKSPLKVQISGSFFCAAKGSQFGSKISLTNIQILMSKMFWQNTPHHYKWPHFFSKGRFHVPTSNTNAKTPDAHDAGEQPKMCSVLHAVSLELRVRYERKCPCGNGAKKWF